MTPERLKELQALVAKLPAEEWDVESHPSREEAQGYLTLENQHGHAICGTENASHFLCLQDRDDRGWEEIGLRDRLEFIAACRKGLPECLELIRVYVSIGIAGMSDELTQMCLENENLKARNTQLLRSIANCGGDDLCWLDLVPRPVQIPPAPEFLESCRRYHAQISIAAGEIEGARTIAQLEARVAELESLFELQHTRDQEAVAMWRAGTGRHDVLPDLGDLLAWLMSEIEKYKKESYSHKTSWEDLNGS